jgi:hypothetical protein
VTKLGQLLHTDNHNDMMKGLDDLRAIAFANADEPMSIDPGGEWWNELDSTSFLAENVRRVRWPS